MRQSFEPKIWGPHAWFFLETIAMGYPDNPSENDIKYAKDFFKGFKLMIPCEKCRFNYEKHLQKMPLTNEILSSKNNFFKWIVDLHNKSFTTTKRTYNETLQYYLDIYTGKKKPLLNKLQTKIIFMVCIIIFITLSYKFFNFIKNKIISS